jgi:hypothetical protein
MIIGYSQYNYLAIISNPIKNQVGKSIPGGYKVQRASSEPFKHCPWCAAKQPKKARLIRIDFWLAYCNSIFVHILS